MAHYSPPAYAALHQGVRVLQAQLKTGAGQAALQAELARTDVLITSFRPSALARLGLGWDGRPFRRAIRACRWCAGHSTAYAGLRTFSRSEKREASAPRDSVRPQAQRSGATTSAQS